MITLVKQSKKSAWAFHSHLANRWLHLAVDLLNSKLLWVIVQYLNFKWYLERKAHCEKTPIFSKELNGHCFPFRWKMQFSPKKSSEIRVISIDLISKVELCYSYKNLFNYMQCSYYICNKNLHPIMKICSFIIKLIKKGVAISSHTSVLLRPST